jgi:hypothetical protein
LYDDFAGTTIDGSKWTFSAPFPSSSVTVADGSAEFRNRGRLLSVDTFSGTLDITGRFQVAGNPFEQFAIATRTTGVSTNPSGDWDTGVRFEIVPVYFGGSTTNNIKIAPVENWAGIPAAFATYAINVGEWYDFRIVDTGSLTSFYIGDLTTPLLSLNVNLVGGNHIGLLNIEGPDGGSFFTQGNLTKLDYIRVEGVPDVVESAVALSFALSLCVFIHRIRRDQVRRSRELTAKPRTLKRQFAI